MLNSSLLRPVQDTLRAWGYIVTTRGGWVTAAGHGAVHRWHGWQALPDLSALAWQGGFDGAANPNPGPVKWTRLSRPPIA